MVSNAKSSKRNNNQTLRFYLVDFKNCNFIKKQMKYFYKKSFNKKTVSEIENYQVFINIMQGIIDYINSPNKYNLHVIKYLVSKFKDSEELLVLYEFYPIIKTYLNDQKLEKVLLPLINMLERNEFKKQKDISYLKKYLSSDDSESESETDQDYLSSPIEYNEFNEDEFIDKENEDKILYEYLNNEDVEDNDVDEDEVIDIVEDEDEDEDEEVIDIVEVEDEDKDEDEAEDEDEEDIVVDKDEDEDEDEDNDIDEDEDGDIDGDNDIDKDEEENDQLIDNTIKTLQSIDKENDTDLTWTYLVNSVFH